MAVYRDRGLHSSPKGGYKYLILGCHPSTILWGLKVAPSNQVNCYSCSGRYQIPNVQECPQLCTPIDAYMWISPCTCFFTTSYWLQYWSGWKWHVAHQTFSPSFALTLYIHSNCFWNQYPQAIRNSCLSSFTRRSGQTADCYFYNYETKPYNLSGWLLWVAGAHLLSHYNDPLPSAEE